MLGGGFGLLLPADNRLDLNLIPSSYKCLLFHFRKMKFSFKYIIGAVKECSTLGEYYPVINKYLDMELIIAVQCTYIQYHYLSRLNVFVFEVCQKLDT